MSRTGQPSRRRRVRRGILLLLAILLAGLVLAAGFLLLTTAGAGWLARRITARLPALSLQVDRGCLWSGLRLRNLAWADGETRIELEQLDARWRIRLRPFPVLHIDRMHGTGVEITIPPSPPPDSPRPWYEALDPANRLPVALPQFRLPLEIRLVDFRLEPIRIHLGGTLHEIAQFGFSAHLQHHRLRIRDFRLHHDQVQATARGTVHLTGDYPVDAALHFRSDRILPAQPLVLDVALSNNLAKLVFDLHLTGIGAIHARGSLAPLDPRLPLHTTLMWHSLAWPWQDEPVIRSAEGRIDFLGSLESYDLEAALGLAGPGLMDTQWALRANGDLRGLAVDPLRVDLPGGPVLARAEVSWTNGLAWRADVEATAYDATAWHPAAPAPIDARLSTSGHWLDGEWDMDLDIASVQSEWNAHALALDGRIAGASATGWSIPQIRLHSGDNDLRLSGTYTDVLDLSGEIMVPALDGLLPGLAGQLEATWTLIGPPASPDLRLALHAAGLAHGDDMQLDALRLDADIVAGATEPSRIELRLEGGAWPGRNLQLDSIVLQALGTLGEHRITLDAEGVPARLSLALSGGMLAGAAEWTGTLERATVAPFGQEWNLEQSVDLHWDSSDGPFTIGPHRWQHADAILTAPEPLELGATGAARLRLDGFDLTELHPLLPDDIRLRGLLSAALDVRWMPEAIPEGAASIELHDAGLILIVADDLFVEDAPPLDVAFDTLALHARLADAALAARFDLEAPGLGAVRAETSVAIAPDRTLGAWSGDIALTTFKLDVLQPFLADLRTLSGEASAAIRLSGSPRRPLLHGTVTLTNGVIEPAAFPVTLGDLHLSGDLQGDRATWTGGFRSGRGLAVLQGDMELREDTWHAQLHLGGERLELAYGTLATLQATPDLHLRVKPRSISLSGVVRIPRADILIQQLPETAVHASPDAVIVDDPDEAASPPAPAAWSRSIDLDLRLGDRITLGGYGITGRLAGDLRLQQTGHGVPLAFGELRIEDGRYRAYGQRLQIRRGQFLFAGPVDQPTLSIEAVRDVPAHGVVAGLRVEGRPDALQSSLFSEPALPEEEVLAFLLLGRPIERGEESDTNVMLARAAIALGIAGGGGTITSLAETIGIENFQLDTAGEGDDTQVVVSGMVSSRLQLSYGVGVFAPANTLTARYRLARRLYLEAVSGLESSLDLLYTFRF